MCVCAFSKTMEFQFQWNWTNVEGAKNIQNPLQPKKIKMTIAYHKLSTDTQEFCSWRVQIVQKHWKGVVGSLCTYYKQTESTFQHSTVYEAIRSYPYPCWNGGCWWNSWNDKSYTFNIKSPFNDDKAHQTTTENYSKFIRWDDTHTQTSRRKQAKTYLDIDDDDGIKTFAEFCSWIWL